MNSRQPHSYNGFCHTHNPYDPPEPYNTEYKNHLYDGRVPRDPTQEANRVAPGKQLCDSSLIVATSDHGESLGEHGEDRLDSSSTATVHVP
jgi:hypothetical protein